MEFHQNIRVDVYYKSITVQNIISICCAIVIEMYGYTLVNFKTVFLRIVFRQMTRAPSLYQTITHELIELGSYVWHRWKAHRTVFHVVPLSQNVIFRLIPDFDGAGHILTSCLRGYCCKICFCRFILGQCFFICASNYDTLQDL